MYGRKVHPRLRAGTALHLYLPGPHRAAFNSAALAGQRSAIVCEAIFDALSFWAAGFRNDAGDAGAEALAKKLLPEGFNCWRVLFPRGMDANDYACKVQPPLKSLGVALRQAAWMGKGSPPGTREFEAAAASPLTALAAPVAAAAPSEAVSGAAEGKSAVSAVAASAVEIITTSANSTAAASAAAAAPPAAATPPLLPAVPKAPEVPAEVSDEEVVLHFGPRRYRVRGLSKALSAEALKVNVLVSQGEAFHVDTLDMYSARQRAAFLRAAAV
jgi:hypothetical protein